MTINNINIITDVGCLILPTGIMIIIVKVKSLNDPM